MATLQVSPEFYIAALPVFIVTAASLVAMLFPFLKVRSVGAHFFLGIVALVAALLAHFITTDASSFLGGAYLSESLAKLGQVLILSIGLFVLILFRGSALSAFFFKSQSLSLFLMTLLGMMVMVASNDLVTLFVGLELSAIGLYVLVGYVYPNRSSLEGAIKYFILGSFASAFLLFGFGLLYAGSSSLNLVEIFRHMDFVNRFWMYIGGLFVLIGLCFKLALMPFHMWAPDAYESAPTGITAFMATATKVMILIVTLRLTQGLDVISAQWMPTLTVLSFLSMIGANILALVQTSIKRMLAYSAIAHSGYMAVALCAMRFGQDLPYQSILFYLIGYALTSLLAFGTLMWLEDETRQNLQVDDLKGLVKSHPWASFALAAAMFSFAGMPPTVGFFGKFFIFNAALREHLYLLVLTGVLGSVISLYYYLRVVVFMYMHKPEEGVSFQPVRSWLTLGILGFAFSSVLALGTIFPEKVMNGLKPITSFLSQR
ncbi:MAG: NADH-quinone oxidoreductase subunit N [Deltaproteobacteria bacterium]|nr:NADH-quinone oxidoreductase subunit N [Deltaproteobacteria bacterium]